jgi:hypothetical protein
MKADKISQNYAIIKKEMLSIIATLKEFRSMLLGADIMILWIIKT